MKAWRTSFLSKGGFCHVERQIGDVEAGLRNELDVGVLAHRCEIGRVGANITWHSFFLSLAKRAVGIGRDREDQIVDLGLAAPIVGEGLVADDGVLLVVDELERAGADRLLVELLGRARLHQVVGIFGREDGAEIHREIGDDRRVRLGERHLDRVVVDLVDALQQLRHVHVVEVVIGAAGDLVIGMVRLPLPVEREQTRHRR